MKPPPKEDRTEARMLRAVALLRRFLDQAELPEGKVAKTLYDRHCRDHGIRDVDVRARLRGSQDTTAKAPPGWASEVWHMVLVLEISKIRENKGEVNSNGSVLILGPFASETMKIIRRVRAFITRVSKETRIDGWTLRMKGALPGYPAKHVPLYSVFSYPEDAVLSAAILMAYNPIRKARHVPPKGAQEGPSGGADGQEEAAYAKPKVHVPPPPPDAVPSSWDPYRDVPPAGGTSRENGKDKKYYAPGSYRPETKDLEEERPPRFQEDPPPSPPGAREALPQARVSQVLKDAHEINGTPSARDLYSGVATLAERILNCQDIVVLVPVERRLTMDYFRRKDPSPRTFTWG